MFQLSQNLLPPSAHHVLAQPGCTQDTAALAAHQRSEYPIFNQPATVSATAETNPIRFSAAASCPTVRSTLCHFSSQKTHTEGLEVRALGALQRHAGCSWQALVEKLLV